jgi:hypothetical protein
MTTDRTGTDAEWALREYERRITTMSSKKMDLISIEEEIRTLTEARARELMATALKQADTEAPEIEIDGERWGNRRVHRGEYHTVFGAIGVDRSVYQRSGRGRVAIPLDLRLGIVEGRYTPKMARVLTRSTALMTDEDAANLLREVGTAIASSSTISRLPRAMGARYETRRDIIEPNLRARDEIPEEAVTMQVALDGVMVPQDGEHARPRGRKADSQDPPRHERRYGPIGADSPADNDGSMGRAWHEGSVGTLAFFDAEGRRLKTIYHARMPEPHKATLVEALEAELRAVLAERPTTNIVFASDGAAPQWAALDALAERVSPTCQGHQMKLVDAFHVAEYVQKAANAIEGIGTSDASILAATWRETIKEKDSGADTVLRSMRARRREATTASRLDELDTAIGYIATQNEHGRMRYSDAEQRNYPIGTGITEAAAKTVVGTRMKRAGARFSQHGGQTVMLFRTALLSERFEALHEELGASYRKDVRIAA